jgi:DNA-binding XRE family transcriptional regulator
MTPAQCRAARAWLDWNQHDLAKRAGCNRDTIRRFENNMQGMHKATQAAIIAA